MTTQETIEALKWLKLRLKLNWRYNLLTNADEVLEIAIETMEKQVPKKPIDDEDGDAICSNCGGKCIKYNRLPNNSRGSNEWGVPRMLLRRMPYRMPLFCRSPSSRTARKVERI